MAKSKQRIADKQSNKSISANVSYAGGIARMAAYVYDFIAVTALLILATILAFLVVIIGNNIGFIDLNAYKDMADYLAHNLIFVSYLAAIIIAFYSYFWCKNGQTWGMKAWHLRVQNSDGSNITFTQALIRMATSAFGLGNLSVIYQNHQAFQDLWAECEVIVLTNELKNR